MTYYQVLWTLGLGVILIIILCVIGYNKHQKRELLEEFQMELDDLEEQHQIELELKVSDALKKSKNVIRGNVSQEMIPLVNGFPYQMSDCKFSGQPIDYLVFNGMSNLRDNKEGQIEIVFADVKSGNAALSTVQRRIKDAIKDGRVRFETWVINNGEFKVK